MTFNNSIDVDLRRSVIMNWGNQGTGKGIHILGGSATFYLSDVLFEMLNEGLRIKGSASGTPGVGVPMVQDVHVTDCVFDNPTVVGLAVQYAKHVSVKGTHFFGANVANIWFSDYSVDVTVGDAVFMSCGANSIELQAVYDAASINGIVIHDSVFSHITGNGIRVAANVGYFTIMGNRFRLTDPGTAGSSTMPYAVVVDSGTSNHFVISGNAGEGVSGVVSNGGTGTDVHVGNNIK
jgi:hypothetical protein